MKNINVVDFDDAVYSYILSKLNEDLKSDFEDELTEIKKKRLGQYDEIKFRNHLINLCLYTSKIDGIDDKLGADIQKTGHKGGLIKTLNHLITKTVEFSNVDVSIQNYSKSLQKKLEKDIQQIETEINKIESDDTYKYYDIIFKVLERAKSNVNRFAEFNLISKSEAVAKEYSDEDINKVANLNFYIQDVVLPLLFRCFNIAYWLSKGGYDKLHMLYQHPTDSEISDALNYCLKDVPVKELGKLLYFLEGNEKLNKNIYIFSLPSGKSCPNASNCKTTVVVDELFNKASLKKLAGNKFTCYAASGQSLYPSKYYKAMVNFKILTEFCKTVDEKTIALNTMVNGFMDNSIIRVHDAGDFFSTDYLSAWLNVAEMHPKKMFYAYTTSINLLNKIVNTRGHLPLNFVFNESEENLTRLFNKDADKIIKSIKERGILKTRMLFNTFKEATEKGMRIDVDDTLAMRGDITEFGLLIHGKGQTGDQRIYSEKFAVLNSYPNDEQTLIKLYYKLPIKYRDRIDIFYDNMSLDSGDKMKQYLNLNFTDIKDYIISNNIYPDLVNTREIIESVIGNSKEHIPQDKMDLVSAFITKEIDYLLTINKELTKTEAKEIVKQKLKDIIDNI